MLLPEQVQRLVELALAEFAPEWQVTGLCSELMPGRVSTRSSQATAARSSINYAG